MLLYKKLLLMTFGTTLVYTAHMCICLCTYVSNIGEDKAVILIVS